MNFEGPGKAQAAPWESQRLLALRRELKLTQPELAKRLRVRLKTLQTWEDGHGRATAWAVPRLDRMERKVGKSVELTMAKKKGFAGGDDLYGQMVDSEQPRRPGPRVIPVGSTTGRMVGARVQTLRRNIKSQSQPQSRPEDELAGKRAQVLSRMLKNGARPQASPEAQLAGKRAQYLKQVLKAGSGPRPAPANRAAAARTEYLKKMLKSGPASVSPVNRAAAARTELLKKTLKASTVSPPPDSRAAGARVQYLSRMLKLQEQSAS